MKTLLTLSSILLASAAFAQSAAVSGTPRATGGVYAHDSALSPEASIVASSTHYAHRAGHVGQLNDLVELQIIASPLTIDERATATLETYAIADDNTYFPLPATAVAWAIESGPLSGITADGTVTAGSVYLDTSATVRGTYRGATGRTDLYLRNVTDDDFGLYADDQLPDAWQVWFFGENNPLAAPTQDPDGDGQDNRFEYTALIQPDSAASRFWLRLEPIVGQPATMRLVFGPVSGGRTYTAVTTDNLVAGPWAPFTSLTPSAAGPEASLTDTAATGPRRFYRIDISIPDRP